jgi:hypothetical protein
MYQKTSKLLAASLAIEEEDQIESSKMKKKTVENESLIEERNETNLMEFETK